MVCDFSSIPSQRQLARNSARTWGSCSGQPRGTGRPLVSWRWSSSTIDWPWDLALRKRWKEVLFPIWSKTSSDFWTVRPEVEFTANFDQKLCDIQQNRSENVLTLSSRLKIAQFYRVSASHRPLEGWQSQLVQCHLFRGVVGRRELWSLQVSQRPKN